MKIVFIVPQNDDQCDRQNCSQDSSISKVFPPVGLARMAGIAGKSATVAVVDERITPDKAPPFAQISIIFINSYNQQRALQIARNYRASGCCVVLTGPMLAHIGEKFNHDADCLFIGAGENNLPEFLADYQKRKTRFCYQNTDNRVHDSKIYHESENTPLQLAS